MTSWPSRSNKLLLHLLNKKKANQAFTLIELLVVIVILGLLGAVGYQQYLNQLRAANAGIARNTATAVAKNCAALLITGDEAAFTVESFLADEVSVSPAACAAGAFTVTAAGGGSAFQQTNNATVTADFAVTPAPRL